MIIERACHQLTAEEVRHKLRNCPPSLRRSPTAKRSPGATAAPRRTVARDQGFSGWLVGSIAPGVSSPAYSPQDGLTLPEVFAPSAWDAVMEQQRQGSKPIGLWMRHHGGVMLACTSMGTLRLERHDILGCMFEAKIEAGPLERMLLAEIGQGGVGCSIAFSHAKFAHEQRDGRRVRVIQSVVVDHVALVRKGSGERALFAAARVFAVKADQRDQLPKAWSDARTESWKVMRGNRV